MHNNNKVGRREYTGRSTANARPHLFLVWGPLACLLLLAGHVVAGSRYSPYVSDTLPRQLLWGDTHLHTGLSLDAKLFGVRLTPEDAYRFARGETVNATHAGPAKLSRPLDFLVVADHSDGFGAMTEIMAGSPRLLADPQVNTWHEQLLAGGDAARAAGMKIILSFTAREIPPVLADDAFVSPIWESYLHTAEQFNEPGRFTALIAYEWTSTEAGNNLHRNVIYRGDAQAAATLLPYTTLESANPEDLWRWMARYERLSGSQVLAIPHNGNVSNGLMFPAELNPASAQPLGKDYVEQRARWEPLYEATQIKGDSESHPLLSPNDEFAGFDQPWDKANLLLVPKQLDMLQYEYAREALKNGLKVQQQLGTNPYKMGLVGGTDSHTGLATGEENNFYGKHAALEPSADRWRQVFAEGNSARILGWEMVGAGYTAVWANANTREAVFDAMMRREVYATTGPRMSVRFFGGWDFTVADLESSDFVRIGYERGVPMGGDLPDSREAGSPTFMLAALKDPESGNLDRLQVIKGWLDDNGDTHERVFDVVWSDKDSRAVDGDGQVSPVGSSVDVASATWSDSIGTTTLRAVWRDPDFDAQQPAFYYLRAIEIPTPRWTAYDAQRFGVTMDDEVPMTVQERAYSSPIWYAP